MRHIVVFVFILIAILLFYAWRFVHLLLKLKGEVIFPVTAEDMASIRKYPQKLNKEPTYTSQKNGIIIYCLLFLYVFLMFSFIMFFHPEPFITTYLLAMLPFLYSRNILRLFAVVDDGILCGARFITWKDIKSYKLLKIDVNHKFYGHDKEVNDQYELKIKTKFISHSCIITSQETLDRLRALFHDKGIEQEVTEVANGENSVEKNYSH